MMVTIFLFVVYKMGEYLGIRLLPLYVCHLQFYGTSVTTYMLSSVEPNPQQNSYC